MLSRLVPAFYDVTLISPENFFLFTPLLTSTAVGTVESRSIVEPIRSITARCNANFFCAQVTEVRTEESSVVCKTAQGQEFSVDYDFLVLAVGAEVNTFGCPGVNEHAIKLKKYDDARAIRRRIANNIETAMIPTVDETARRRLLTNVVVGGGPTGVEFAAELYELIREDFPLNYPPDLLKDCKVILVQSADHILNTYDLHISQYAESLFARQGIEVLKNAMVVAIEPDKVIYEEKTAGAADKAAPVHEIPYGLCVWATGVRMVPLIQRLSDTIPEQMHNSALMVDSWLRVRGVPSRNIFALGDCATIERPRLRQHFKQFLDDQQPSIQVADLAEFTRSLLEDHPELRVHFTFLTQLVKKYSHNRGNVSSAVLGRLIEEVEMSMRTLPATAQVAQQQGRYLGEQFNSFAIQRLAGDPARCDLPEDIKKIVPPFVYKHAGMSAYVGSRHAVFDLGRTYLADRYLAFWLWRSVYLSKQVSLRTRVMVAFDWTKTLLFGRDISSPQ